MGCKNTSKHSKNSQFYVILMFFFALFACHIEALEGNFTIPDKYDDIKNFVPEDIFEFLPDGIFSSDIEDINSALDELTSLEYAAQILSRILNVELKSSLELLCILSCGILLCSIINSLNSKELSSSGSEISSFVSSILIVIILVDSTSDIFSCSKIFFDRLNLFMTGMLPFLCTLCAIGGGAASAAATNYGITAFITISELALSSSVMPIAGTCLSLASIGAVGETNAGSSLLKGLKKLYIFLIGMLMTLMLFMFSARGIMASSADSLSGRAIKFAAGSFIPIVGSNIGDILKGVGSGIGYIKSTVGVVSVIIILLMLLPTFISIAVRRLVLSICSILADLLGERKQSKLISEFSSVYGLMLAVISMSSVLFIGAVIISVRIGNTLA